MSDTHKILLVEDDNFTRFMMREIIDTLGVAVDVAEDGEQGCRQLASNPNVYDLVLMDIHMPLLSGVDATKRIRALPDDPPKNVPIIAVTADEAYHDEIVVNKYGMNGFLAKPISPGEILGLIDQYCGTA